MSEHATIEQALADALPVELRGHAADLAALLGDLAEGRIDPAGLESTLITNPILRTALVALAGQPLAVAGRSLQIVAGSVGTLQQITISGGYVERIVGTSITIQLPPPPEIPPPAVSIPPSFVRPATSLIGRTPLLDDLRARLCARPPPASRPVRDAWGW